MCTFKITNYNKEFKIDKYLKLGGPDLSEQIIIDGVSFTHNLLSITGEVTPQPIIKNNILYMLLGEIYNYDRKYKSDIYSVIELYEFHGDKFTEFLDGEFLVIVFDITSGLINFYTDPWATKMAWFNTFDDYFYFGSFSLTDTSLRLLHNSHSVFNVKTKEFSYINKNLHKWYLKQYKDNYKDWTLYFMQAVDKRFHKESVLALSGGLDSSAIAACMKDLHQSFDSIILNFSKDREDSNSLNSIINYITNENDNIIWVDNPKILNTRTKSFTFIIKKDLEDHPLNYICSTVNSLNKRVLFTGQGADEIMDNYITKFTHRSTNNLNMSYWPDDLENYFPYDNFYENKQRRQIDANQYISLSNGIEIRNPFLDKQLAQEWLSLSVDLKRSGFKSPLQNFLLNRGIELPKKIAGLGNQFLLYEKLLDTN